MTKAQLDLLNVRDVEALGQTIKIRDLTIGEMVGLQKLPEEDQMFHLVNMMMVEPKLTVNDLKNLPQKYLPDLTKIVEEVSKAQ